MKVKTCLVTGATGAIGGAIAKSLANNGYQLILHGNKNMDGLHDLIGKLPEHSVLATIQADLSTEKGIESFLKQLHFSIDAFVHSSGRPLYGLFQEIEKREMDEMLTLHVKAPWLISQHVIKDMVKNQSGKIILVSSIWGDVGASFEVIYSSVKGAQNSFVKALARETARSGIQVNAVSPGYIDTAMNDHLSSEEREILINEIPAGKPGKPEEVANLVSFLLSNQASYINGQVIGINGAWY
ncbi:3-oxoacyl-[acyl-carrier protein] reductase [Melghiribacillus thermohalophilus]|uniref:3-oxoacyl-[acyl-carrier protein] reductase n=1 Tax=Melghiribacillus thermohalophilus TaxID=1324956 RepID=A0A4R3NCK3_9BACI|nr:SDR family oxidoreductase [Melghiribacillus thermohalophilus]TCT26703.1 3-oxoacyl-[acyl-carrier protein] reductase [Melghiribacillus thermohalophilus]